MGETDDGSMEFDEFVSTEEAVNIPEQIGDYSIKGLIGSGGMGQVYLAEHIRMQRSVAIKMLKSDRMKNQAAIDRFYDEVRAVSRLMHPNIVAAFDAGEFDEIHYLAMEYVDGVTLTKWVSRNGPLSLGEAVSVIRQAALGLLHAHRAGIVHRDVKPGNIMRAVDGTIKVLDMGLAQIGDALLTANAAKQGSTDEQRSDLKGRLIGTLAYMSPEQLESPETVDSRTDIYSLGAVMYFLLTAKPPFTGEYLDQVYGHRHGEIPDLMQLRDDVDLNFANIFRRMMAKTPDNRYASLDEVIDDLASYSDMSSAPLWLAEFTKRQMESDTTAASGGSTSAAAVQVMAVDVGMSYTCIAEATPLGEVKLLNPGGENQTLFRTMIASEAGRLVFDQEAQQMRQLKPKQSVHCLSMYIGKDVVDREICGRKCPPEVLLALVIRRAVQNAWHSKNMPDAVALTVPASYDQLHRKSFLQAARIAGLKSVRLVDRGTAAVQSLLLGPQLEPLDDQGGLESQNDKTILFTSVTGQASEIAVMRLESGRLQQLATAGHWHNGTITWLSNLVAVAAKAFEEEFQFDPRASLTTASQLQLACERAMNSLFLLPSAKINIEHEGQTKTVVVERNQWLRECMDLIAGLYKEIKSTLKRADIAPEQIDQCVTLGPLVRISSVRNRLFRRLRSDVELIPVERTNVARGAAACLAAELPGRGDLAAPPRSVTSQSLGILVEDIRGRSRILPIIPRGTALPARTNRRLTVAKDRSSMTLSLVESSGIHADDWHALGRYEFEIGEDERKSRLKRTRMIGFEVNVNGMLTVRAQTPGQHGSTTLESLPKPVLSDEEIPEWIEWISDLS